jgi:hypothetical protein
LNVKENFGYLEIELLNYFLSHFFLPFALKINVGIKKLQTVDFRKARFKKKKLHCFQVALHNFVKRLNYINEFKILKEK